MKGLRIIISTLLLFCAYVCAEAQNIHPQLDSTVVEALDRKLDEYFRTLEPETGEVKVRECDFILESIDDSLMLQHVALYIYDHYLSSNVMGDETVAVHMVDDWFAAGKVKMVDDMDLINAKVYAQFTRNSLVGHKAPVLQMKYQNGELQTLPQEGALSILFFYDVTCAKCKLETLKLASLLKDMDYPVEFFAVYSGIHRTEWLRYVEERWNFETAGVTIHHLWDPDLDSNFQVEYGVLQTPQMLLVDKDGTILGRHLDTDALKTLLDAVIPIPYDYGTGSSMDFFSELFDGGDESAEQLMEMAEYISSRADQTGDPGLRRHMLGDFMYFLMDMNGEGYKAALAEFIDRYVDGEQLWTEPEDVSRIVGPAHVAKDLLSRVPVGSKMPKIKVEARVKTLSMKGRDLESLPVRKVNLRRLKSDNAFVIFHSPGCSACAEVAAMADAYLEEYPDARLHFVEPTLEMLDIFDLTVLPHIMKVDRKGVVIRKYMNSLW